MAKFSLSFWEEDDSEGPSSPTPKKQRTTRTHQEQEHEGEEEEEEAEEEAIEESEHEEEVESEEEQEEEEVEVEVEEEGDRNEGQRTNVGPESNGGGTGDDRCSVGPNRDGSISVTLTDPDVLDCPICLEPLTIPVFQCENGHIACSSCCVKLRNKCPSCSLPIGYNRCRAIEKVLESVKISCRNMKYGCKETVSYSKIHDHEMTCIHVPCSCPLLDCDFVGSSRHLSLHINNKHSNSVENFYYDCLFHISLEMDQKHLILQEQNEGKIFILNNCVEVIGNVVNLSCLGPSSSKILFSYELIARNGDSVVRLQSFAESIPRWAEHLTLKRFLMVPNDFIGSHRQLKLELRIWRHH